MQKHVARHQSSFGTAMVLLSRMPAMDCIAAPRLPCRNPSPLVDFGEAIRCAGPSTPGPGPPTPGPGCIMCCSGGKLCLVGVQPSCQNGDGRQKRQLSDESFHLFPRSLGGGPVSCPPSCHRRTVPLGRRQAALGSSGFLMEQSDWTHTVASLYDPLEASRTSPMSVIGTYTP